MSISRPLALLFLVSAVFGGAGCENDLDGGGGGVDDGSGASNVEGGVIVGAVDWVDAIDLPAASVERKASRATAYVTVPEAQARCSGFLISADVLMTNRHCIPTAYFATNVRAHFLYERTDVAAGIVVCDEFIGADEALDYALVRCKGRPGDVYGFLDLDDRALTEGFGIQLFHQQCDSFTTPDCLPVKKMSPGRITGGIGPDRITHDADMLGGSSGGAIVAKGTTRVVALNNSHFVNSTNGRGTTNLGVPMRRILPQLRARFPSVLGPDPACAAIAAAGRVVDEDDGCVTLGGDPRYLRAVEDAGNDGDLVWTGTTAHATPSNFAAYTLRFERAGRYEIAASLSSTYATATTARYAVRHGGVVDTVTVDQRGKDGFVVIGTFDFAAGGDQSVIVGDNTGASGEQVVFDAVRVTPTTPAPAAACAHIRITAATLNVRPTASTAQAAVGSLVAGDVVDRTATVVGQSVRGTTTWYGIASPAGYVSAAYAVCAD